MAGLQLGYLLGGIGLFLLGMTLMTDGLKLAVGPALGKWLKRWTATRVRGLFFGIGATALVQSSTAITVAAIGFVNAGLLPLSQSLWVFFGSNVGTTFTGWLVAILGFKVKLDAAALPLIGLGMLCKLTGPETRRGALGGAVAGFGILFLGIGFLQQAFVADSRSLDLSQLSGYGFWSVLAFTLAGIVLTVVMQASAAVLAVVLTLAEAGVLPLNEAAAAVIGANIGTTATAVLAAISATPNAQRAALAHVMFNLLTGIIALVLLPALLQLIANIQQILDLAPSSAMSLALFHTLFNLLGVILMWPLTERLGKFLAQRFTTQEEEQGRPRYIDRNVAAVPSLAVDALYREVIRLGGMCLQQTQAIYHPTHVANPPLKLDAVPMLSQSIVDFVNTVNQHVMPQDTSRHLAALLRIHRYYEVCYELVREATPLRPHVAKLAATPNPLYHDHLLPWLEQVGCVLQQLDPTQADFLERPIAGIEAIEEGYQTLKAYLLEQGASGGLSVEKMDELIRYCSDLRRLLKQAHKAAHTLNSVHPHQENALQFA